MHNSGVSRRGNEKACLEMKRRGQVAFVIPGWAERRSPGIDSPHQCWERWILRCAIAHHSSMLRIRPGMTKTGCLKLSDEAAGSAAADEGGDLIKRKRSRRTLCDVFDYNDFEERTCASLFRLRSPRLCRLRRYCPKLSPKPVATGSARPAITGIVIALGLLSSTRIAGCVGTAIAGIAERRRLK